MAYEFAMQIKSALNNNYLTDSKYVRGTYHVVATTSEMDTLVVDSGSGGVIVEGSLCYCQADDKIYKYNGTTWEELELGGSGLEKLTYEWNKEVAMGSSGYVKIGSFPMYDTNITIDIDATTSTSYHGTAIVVTQNTSTSSMGSAHKVDVYDDPTGIIASSLRVVWTNGSRNYDIYFVPESWSKNVIHIRAVALSSAPDESTICQKITSGTAPETTSGITITNILDLSQNGLISKLGLGTSQTSNSSQWGTLTSSNGYTLKLRADQGAGGSFVIAEKDGKTFLQVDGEIYVNEGTKRLMHTDEFDSMMSTWISNHAYNGTYQ